MSSDRRDSQKDLDAILEGILDSIDAATAEEIAEDAKTAGEDLKSAAQEVKSALLAGVKHFEQRKLQAARAAYRSREGEQSRKYVLPATPAERRQQLFGIFQAKPELQGRLTAQYRDFDSLTDEDIQTALEDLAELGLFNDLEQRND